MKTYYLYLDESGSRFPDKSPPNLRTDKMDYFAIGGILVEEGRREELELRHSNFCNFWKIDYPLHSTKIRGKRDKFAWLGENADRCDQFMEDLKNLLCELPVVGFAAVIDREGYNTRYHQYGAQRWSMCKTAFTIVVERAAKYVDAIGGKLKIRFEESGRDSDRALQNYLKNLKSVGHPFDSARSKSYQGLSNLDYQRIILGDAERLKKIAPALQFADLYLYPMVKWGYDETYSPAQDLIKSRKIIDALLAPDMLPILGIKYSCFERVNKQKA